MRTIPVTTFDPRGRVVSTGETQIPDEPVAPDERIAALEAQVEAVTALAEDANATAQEVAQAMRDARPGKP